MSASLEIQHRTRASVITAGFAAMMVLMMLLLKWKLPVFEKITQEPGIEVELNLPEDPPMPALGGGGGGGNPVEAKGLAGIAPPTPPAPGVNEESKDIETDDEDKEAPPVVRPTNPKPVNKVVENTSVVKTTPKPVIIENPAPPRPKAVLGRTTSGSNTGGGVATTYDRSGGRGNGTGVGNGSGNGGGTGGGNGGGNGTGSGTGTGPRRVSGSRVVINPKSMDAGENLRGKVFAEIKVSPDGVGTFVRANRGSVYTSGQAIDIIREWLRRNRFNKSNEESTVVYEFNFLLGG
ncbi:MAG TPA: hypothetical protein VFX58_19400 [Chitinophagaceae bacterium]|nr:hypothetical protein [Chitinophagaceae bacterium]